MSARLLSIKNWPIGVTRPSLWWRLFLFFIWSRISFFVTFPLSSTSWRLMILVNGLANSSIVTFPLPSSSKRKKPLTMCERMRSIHKSSYSSNDKAPSLSALNFDNFYLRAVSTSFLVTAPSEFTSYSSNILSMPFIMLWYPSWPPPPMPLAGAKPFQT